MLAIPLLPQAMSLLLAGMLFLTPILPPFTVQHTPTVISQVTVYEQDNRLLIIDQIEGGSQIVLLAEKTDKGRKVKDVIVVKKNGKTITNPKTGETTTEEQIVIEKWTEHVNAPGFKDRVVDSAIGLLQKIRSKAVN